jgi:hypothetical protein
MNPWFSSTHRADGIDQSSVTDPIRLNTFWQLSRRFVVPGALGTYLWIIAILATWKSLWRGFRFDGSSDPSERPIRIAGIRPILKVNSVSRGIRTARARDCPPLMAPTIRSHQTVVARRFHVIGVRLDRIALADQPSHSIGLRPALCSNCEERNEPKDQDRVAVTPVQSGGCWFEVDLSEKGAKQYCYHRRSSRTCTIRERFFPLGGLPPQVEFTKSLLEGLSLRESDELGFFPRLKRQRNRHRTAPVIIIPDTLPEKQRPQQANQAGCRQSSAGRLALALAQEPVRDVPVLVGSRTTADRWAAASRVLLSSIQCCTTSMREI